MFTQQALEKAKKDLQTIISNHAMQDYKNHAYDKNGKRKKRFSRPISLSVDTLKAQEIYSLIYSKNPEQITEEQEKQIKEFLLIYRTSRREYLEENGGNKYYNS